MKTKLQIALAAIAPSIAIKTLWRHDNDSGPVSKECDGFSEDENDDWHAWQSEVRASAIIAGETISGNDYVGGIFEKAGDNPAVSNPDISGYENGMTQEALLSLAAGVPDDHPVQAEIARALKHCKTAARERYEAQRAEIDAGKSGLATA
jgi:hypothetical protein